MPDKPQARSASNAVSTFAHVALDLQHVAFPVLAAALRDRTGSILKRWRDLSLQVMPHLDRMTLEEFENLIAIILSTVADALQSEDPQQLRALIDSAPAHGLKQFALKTNLLDYFEEERILRGVVIIELGEGMKRPLSVNEAATFHAIFDIMIQQGAIALVEKQREQVRDVEESLQESQRFLRSSLDALTGNIAVIDEAGTILDVNESWRRFAGENRFVGPACGVGTNYLQACERAAANDETCAATAQGIRDVIAGRRDQFETEYPCHSATEQRWFLMRVTRFQGAGPNRIIIAHDNITQRKQAENSRHDLAERFAEHSRIFNRVLSSITDFAYTFDLEGRFTFANKPLLDLWGMTLEQAVGKNFFDLKYPEDLATKLHREIQQVIDTKQRVVGETPYTSPTGKGGYYQYIFSPILAADGAVEAVAGSTRDVTEQKHVEKALRLSMVEQARLLDSERTSRNAAEHASRAKDKFLAVLSHELRTPLTPVVMTVAALELNADLPATVLEDLKMIRRNVELESKLIDDLLDISRIISGKLLLRFDLLDINELVRHVCDMCRSNVREKGIRLHCDLDRAASTVVGDPVRLHQVFWNLLTNAAKFTPAGGEIFVRTENLDDGQMRVTVRDTGMGIPDDLLPRIFDAFEQGDVRVTRQFGGMGLGLAITKALVEQHRGAIRAETAGVNKGSVFVVELPATSRTEADRTPAKPLNSGDRTVGALRLLVVEDHADTARVLKKLLTALGHNVITAHTASDAMALANEHGFDIMISDLGLPDETGYELMKQIKQKYGTKGIAMSGYGMEEDFKKSEQAGFSDHLVKPVNFALLEQAISRVAGNGTALK